MANPLFLHGAYGVHYKTKREVLTAWESGVDFKIWGGPYCSIRDYDAIMRDHGKIILSYGNDNYIILENKNVV